MDVVVESSIFAFSAASLSLWSAILSFRRSIPVLALKSSAIQSIIRLVPVVTTEVRVPAGRLHLEHPAADLEYAHVESAAAEVEDQYRLLFLLVEPVRERCRRRFVDDPSTSSPAIFPASFVACLWLSSKYAGVVITAWVIFSPRYSSASLLSF